MIGAVIVFGVAEPLIGDITFDTVAFAGTGGGAFGAFDKASCEDNREVRLGVRPIRLFKF